MDTAEAVVLETPLATRADMETHRWTVSTLQFRVSLCVDILLIRVLLLTPHRKFNVSFSAESQDFESSILIELSRRSRSLGRGCQLQHLHPPSFAFPGPYICKLERIPGALLGNDSTNGIDRDDY